MFSQELFRVGAEFVTTEIYVIIVGQKMVGFICPFSPFSTFFGLLFLFQSYFSLFFSLFF